MTVVTITPVGRSPFVLAGYVNSLNWWLLRDGLEGWYNPLSAKSAVEAAPAGQDGGFEPSSIDVAPRVVTITGAHQAADGVTAQLMARDRLAEMVKRRVTVTVTDALGTRSATGVVQGQPVVVERDETTCEFSVIIECADPRKYGPSRTVSATPGGSDTDDGLRFPLFEEGYLEFGEFEVSGGLLLSNAGTADSWPVFRVRGGIDSGGFTIASGGDLLRFDAAVPLGKELVLSPYAGGRAILGGVDVSVSLVQADWSPLGPGESRQFAFTAPGSYTDSARAVAEIRDAWW